MDKRRPRPARIERVASLDRALRAMFDEAARTTPADLLTLLYRLEPKGAAA